MKQICHANSTMYIFNHSVHYILVLLVLLEDTNAVWSLWQSSAPQHTQNIEQNSLSAEQLHLF